MKRFLKAGVTPAAIVVVLLLLTAGGAYALAGGSSKINACVMAGTRTLYKSPCHTGDTPISWLATINGIHAGGALTGTYPSPKLAAGSVGPAAIAGIPGGRTDSSSSSLPANTDTLPCFPKPGPSDLRFESGGMSTHVTSFDGSSCPSGQVNEFVVPRTGAYLVTASVMMHDAGGVTANRYLYIRDGFVGSDGGTELDTTSGSDGNTTLSTSAVLHLPASDGVFLDVRSSSAETITAMGNTQLSIAWLGQ